MKTIHFNENGTPVSDYKIQEFVDRIVASPDGSIFNISTALVIHEVRARIKEEKIGVNDITVIVDDYEFIIDKDGRSDNWTKAIAQFEDILMRLL